MDKKYIDQTAEILTRKAENLMCTSYPTSLLADFGRIAQKITGPFLFRLNLSRVLDLVEWTYKMCCDIYYWKLGARPEKNVLFNFPTRIRSIMAGILLEETTHGFLDEYF